MKYLFYIAKIYSIPIIKPLVNYLNKTNDDYRFYISQKVEENFPDKWDRKKILRHLTIAKKFNPDFILCPGNFVDFRIPGLKVQLFHGLGIEKSSHYKIRHFFDVFLTSGPFVTEKFEKLQKEYKYFLVKETGWPKVDYILQYNAQNVKNKFDIPNNKKVILYAPTFSKTMESASELLPIIPETVRDDETWLLKFHELMDENIINEIKERNLPNIKIIDTIDITPLLHASDVLISDTSSVIYEFMVLKEPVITYKSQNRKDKGINIQSSSELRSALDEALKRPYAENRNKHLKEVNPYLDGQITKRVFETLTDIKVKNLLPNKRKPFNMFRKWQVIYHSLFQKGYLR